MFRARYFAAVASVGCAAGPCSCGTNKKPESKPEIGES